MFQSRTQTDEYVGNLSIDELGLNMLEDNEYIVGYHINVENRHGTADFDVDVMVIDSKTGISTYHDIENWVLSNPGQEIPLIVKELRFKSLEDFLYKLSKRLDIVLWKHNLEQFSFSNPLN